MSICFSAKKNDNTLQEVIMKNWLMVVLGLILVAGCYASQKPNKAGAMHGDVLHLLV